MVANQTNSFGLSPLGVFTPGGSLIDLPTETVGNLPGDRLEQVIVESGSVLPSAGTPGRLFFLTDDGLIYRDDGSAWDSIEGTPDPLFSCPIGVLVGDVVYISGADTVDKADASDVSTTPAIGIVSGKPTSTTCRVKRDGVFSGFSGLTPNSLVFLSTTPGQITEIQPSGDNQIVQVIGVVKDVDAIVLDVDLSLTIIEIP